MPQGQRIGIRFNPGEPITIYFGVPEAPGFSGSSSLDMTAGSFTLIQSSVVDQGGGTYGSLPGFMGGPALVNTVSIPWTIWFEPPPGDYTGVRVTASVSDFTGLKADVLIDDNGVVTTLISNGGNTMEGMFGSADFSLQRMVDFTISSEPALVWTNFLNSEEVIP